MIIDSIVSSLLRVFLSSQSEQNRKPIIEEKRPIIEIDYCRDKDMEKCNLQKNSVVYTYVALNKCFL